MSWYRYLDVREIKVRGVRVSRDHGGNSPPVRSKPRTTIFPIAGACPSTYPNHDILLNPGRNSGQEAGGEASIIAGTREGKHQSLLELRRGSINPCRNSGRKHQSLPELGKEASILAGTQEEKPQSLPELRRGSLNPCRNTGGEASILAGIQEGKPQSLPEYRRGSFNPCWNSGGKPQSLLELRREASILAGIQEGSFNPC